jgi:hypothetical protein
LTPTKKPAEKKLDNKKPAKPTKDVASQGPGFPIVGVGASAGGLEALEVFLANTPADCGMAFVIIQHLDPDHKGVLAELLQRGTKMKVFQVQDRMRIELNCVYVIPPNKDMSILHGVLHLLEPVAPRGLRLPIDFFFRALADDQQEKSIGVILSGMGSDGTLGLRAIKEKAGVVFVQEPGSAKFDSMPRSVIDAGLADVTVPAKGARQRPQPRSAKLLVDARYRTSQAGYGFQAGQRPHRVDRSSFVRGNGAAGLGRGRQAGVCDSIIRRLVGATRVFRDPLSISHAALRADGGRCAHPAHCVRQRRQPAPVARRGPSP